MDPTPVSCSSYRNRLNYGLLGAGGSTPRKMTLNKFSGGFSDARAKLDGTSESDLRLIVLITDEAEYSNGDLCLVARAFKQASRWLDARVVKLGPQQLLTL